MLWDYMLSYIWLIWIISSLLFVRFYVYLFTYRSKVIAKPIRDRFGTRRIIFQVTTKGNIPIVQETVDRVNSVCREIEYKKYELWVVTDVQEIFENCRTIIVPADYSCNAVYKGRALQYAVELRKKEKKNTNDIYIFHLDDESLVTRQTLCSLLTYLEDHPAPISEGLIIYPLQEKEKIKITNLLDTLRPFCCFECLDFMSRGRPAYIHGSNLLMRSDIEEDVGWANGKTIAEDTLFAVKAKNKFGSKVFGWHGGVIEEKSPVTLEDLIKQRKRWFYGLIQNMKYFPIKEKISQSIRAFIWSFGFVSALASIFAWVVVWLYPYLGMPGYLRIIFSITSLLWLLSYQIGAYFNGKYLQLRKRVKLHLLALAAAFGLGLIECSTPLISLIDRPKTFEIIKK